LTSVQSGHELLSMHTLQESCAESLVG